MSFSVVSNLCFDIPMLISNRLISYFMLKLNIVNEKLHFKQHNQINSIDFNVKVKHVL